MNGRQSGLGLIEVLIAALVFALGLLGLLGAQISAKKNGMEALQRSIATELARDLLERMRSNPRQLEAYRLDNAAPASAPSALLACGGSALSAGGALRCSPAELAEHDLAEWLQLLAGAATAATVDGMPGAFAGLLEPRACVVTTAGRVSVAIAWRGLEPMATPAGYSCGLGGGWYGPGDELRRVLVMQSWIGSPDPGVGG